MDSNLLKVFVAVANTKSISLGAKKLNYTQSNATLRIKQLEKSIGYDLFHRTNRGVVLTLEGEKLYPYAVDILKKVEEASLRMKNINYQELLRVGSTQSNATLRLLPIIDMLKKEFPDMKLEISVDSSKNLKEKILDYKFDIVFINGNPKNKDLEILNIFQDEIYFIEPKDKKAQNTLLAYKEGCAYCTELENYVKKNKTESYKTVYLENYELILGSVNAGYGVSLLSRGIIKKFGYLEKLKLTKIDINIDAFLVSRKDYMPMIEKYLREIKI